MIKGRNVGKEGAAGNGDYIDRIMITVHSVRGFFWLWLRAPQD